MVLKSVFIVVVWWHVQSWRNVVVRPKGVIGQSVDAGSCMTEWLVHLKIKFPNAIVVSRLVLSNLQTKFQTCWLVFYTIQSTCWNPDVLIGVFLCFSRKGNISKLIFEGLKSIFWLQSLEKAGGSAERVVLLSVRVLMSLSTSCRWGCLQRGTSLLLFWGNQRAFQRWYVDSVNQRN